MDLNLRVLKEPRGFIRAVQFVMSIFAFSTTAGYSDTAKFDMDCGKSKKNVTISFGYPFRKIEFNKPDGDDPCSDELKGLTYNYSFASSAEFFVATGVLTFLFTIGICAIYILLNKMYTTNQLVPIADLGASAVLTLFWLAGSSAWAQGVSDIKYYTNPNTFIKRLTKCKEDSSMCNPIDYGNYASLNVSLIFGFANFALWAASMWFVYKDTIFHTQREAAMQPPQQAPMPPQSQSPPSGVQSPDAYKY